MISLVQNFDRSRHYTSMVRVKDDFISSKFWNYLFFHTCVPTLCLVAGCSGKTVLCICGGWSEHYLLAYRYVISTKISCTGSVETIIA